MAASMSPVIHLNVDLWSTFPVTGYIDSGSTSPVIHLDVDLGSTSTVTGKFHGNKANLSFLHHYFDAVHSSHLEKYKFR